MIESSPEQPCPSGPRCAAALWMTLTAVGRFAALPTAVPITTAVGE